MECKIHMNNLGQSMKQKRHLTFMVSLLGACSKFKENSYSILYFFYYWLEKLVKLNSGQDELFYKFFSNVQRV